MPVGLCLQLLSGGHIPHERGGPYPGPPLSLTQRAAPPSVRGAQGRLPEPQTAAHERRAHGQGNQHGGFESVMLGQPAKARRHDEKAPIAQEGNNGTGRGGRQGPVRAGRLMAMGIIGESPSPMSAKPQRQTPGHGERRTSPRPRKARDAPASNSAKSPKYSRNLSSVSLATAIGADKAPKQRAAVPASAPFTFWSNSPPILRTSLPQ